MNLKKIVRKMAKKLSSSNGEFRGMDENEIEKIKEEIEEGEKLDE